METMCLTSSSLYSQGKIEANKKETFYLFYHIVCVKKYATCFVTISFLQIDISRVKYFHMWVTFWIVLSKDKVKSRVHLKIKLFGDDFILSIIIYGTLFKCLALVQFLVRHYRRSNVSLVFIWLHYRSM